MLNDFKFSYVNIDQRVLTNELNVKAKYYANVVHWTIIYSIPIFWLLDYLFLPNKWTELLLIRLIVALFTHIFYQLGGKRRWSIQNTIAIILGCNYILHATVCATVSITQMLPYFLLFSIIMLLVNITLLTKIFYATTLCLFTYFILIVEFKIFNKYDGYDAYVNNGAGLFFVISGFSCLISFNRYQLAKRETAKNILIDQANGRLLDQNEKISDQRIEIEVVNREVEKISGYRLNTLNTILHDFRNFTGSIQMSLELLKNTDSNLTSEQKEILSYIGVGNDKLKYLSEKLSVSADTKNGTIEYNNSIIDLGQEIENFIVSIADAAQMKQIGLQLNADPSPTKVFLDKIFLDQVLQKLFSNAIRYANSGSIIAIHVFKLADKAVVEISNKGRALGTEKLNQLFNKLDDLQDNTSFATQAALGFSVAKQTTEQMGGKLTFSSSEVIGNFYRLEFNRTL